MNNDERDFYVSKHALDEGACSQPPWLPCLPSFFRTRLVGRRNCSVSWIPLRGSISEPNA